MAIIMATDSLMIILGSLYLAVAVKSTNQLQRVVRLSPIHGHQKHRANYDVFAYIDRMN